MEQSGEPPTVRIATAADLDGMVRTLTSAFLRDPLWGPSFPDDAHRVEQMSAFWRLFATSALRYPWSFVTEECASLSIWLPPGGEDLTEDEARGYDAFLVDLVGAEAAHRIGVVSAQFEELRPTEPHYYLNFLATHDDHRGHGLGMALLRQNLDRVDALGAAAYLESTNPANNARYRRVGFEPRGAFTTATGHVVTTMWRSAR
ncbi:GNAT family N-acetyltransferase [Glaciihabitans sp. INWT7]|uniref:GNAT family N-acetyltransferase n=1 Tax=Glaciihabitans sp. INWT7 TaxID=2596912 RepID=UPI00162319D2|nr:GNAT family N-acetyltransferase [Glaciihabitans sp. INWT7]QNE46066.1 GNAT family N-acetyltransferase [Glaciihabitans sp. INWT7]